MSESAKVGSVAWTDLTVSDAEGLRDFYEEVVGWTASPVSMGEYQDFNMVSPAMGVPAAGICHARGSNADLPPVWMIYIVVENLQESLEACGRGGGEIIVGPRSMGPESSYAVIRDPAGAVAALYQAGD